MERVTFQDGTLVARIKETCVATWKNAVPGFETACLDDKELRGWGAVVRAQFVTYPGTASSNVSTVFSTADGKVLHVAPGTFSASDLLRELELALSIRDAVEAAGKDAAAREKACAAKHAERSRELAKGKLPEGVSKALKKVHETFAKRPLIPLDELKIEDYSDEKLDPDATREGGLETKKQFAKAFAR